MIQKGLSVDSVSRIWTRCPSQVPTLSTRLGLQPWYRTRHWILPQRPRRFEEACCELNWLHKHTHTPLTHCASLVWGYIQLRAQASSVSHSLRLVLGWVATLEDLASWIWVRVNSNLWSTVYGRIFACPRAAQLTSPRDSGWRENAYSRPWDRSTGRHTR